MKIVECKCPSCGASLNAEGNAEFLKCDFCGSNLYLETVVKPVDKNKIAKQNIDSELFSFFNELLAKMKEAKMKIKRGLVDNEHWSTVKETPYHVGDLTIKSFKEDIEISYPDWRFQRITFEFYGNNMIIHINPGNILVDDSEVSFIGHSAEHQEKQRQDFYSLPSEKREALRKYVYYAFKASYYSKFLCKYVDFSNLKNRYETDSTYIMGTEDIPKDKVDGELETMVKIMRGIEAEVRRDEALLEEKINNNIDLTGYTKTK